MAKSINDGTTMREIKIERKTKRTDERKTVHK